MVSQESPDTVLCATASDASETVHCSLSLWNSLTIGFATVSLVGGLYTIIGVQVVVAGVGWSLFEFINIAWPRPYAGSPDVLWWQ